MKFRLLGTAVAALALAFASAAPAFAAKTITEQVVRGRLVAPDDGDAEGHFKFETWTRGDKVKERMRVWAKGLDATEDDAGDLPEYSLFLISEDGNTEADFGVVRLKDNGKARFKFFSGRDDYPGVVDEVRDFAGGTVELRDDADAVLLEGDIPDYIGLDDDNEAGTHSRVKAVGWRNLNAVDDDSHGRAKLVTRYRNRPRGADEQLLLVVRLVPRGRYTLVAIDDENTETEVGEFRARTFLGIGVLELDSRDGTDIAGGGVLDLGGQKAEVRNADDEVVLRGRFPDLL